MVNNELIKDDLYMAVNGDWLKTAKIPADKAATGGFYNLADDIEKTLMEDFANFMTGEAISDDKYLSQLPQSKDVGLVTHDLTVSGNNATSLLPHYTWLHHWVVDSTHLTNTFTH